MENIFLVHVHIDHVVQIARFRIDVVLNGVDAMVDVDFLARHVARKATHMVVQGQNIRIKAIDQVVEGL